MNKTCAQWAEELSDNGPEELDELVQAIIDDARAGMVPEPKLGTSEAPAHGDCACEKCQPALFKARARIVELEAELAKAWEAGRDAAVKLIEDRSGPHPGFGQSPEVCKSCQALADLRALQPPGGKAK